ncbi:hypothetical protein CDD82_5282 [Ophiocordyceps australis]|uniref:Ecp2 effector protein domain-containing protein n=1 Tax=Ophiocordyceps australis TaxID=1399860 RepID=A0A2C5ZRM1_9HYPO|nr:hypothetical protein CDD82_5282 [Ophiocordyceps australis]
MKLVALSTLFWGLALASPLSMEHELEKRLTWVPSWEMQVTPGGEKVTVHGTVQEVYARMAELNPNWHAEFATNITDSEDESWIESAAALEKRNDWTGATVMCNKGWPPIIPSYYQNGIQHLMKVPGQPRNDAGPRECGRVACHKFGAVIWCNDDDKPKTLESFKSIANGGIFIWDNCNTGTNNAYSGQAFHPTKWNVILRGQDCAKAYKNEKNEKGPKTSTPPGAPPFGVTPPGGWPSDPPIKPPTQHCDIY